MIRHSGSRTTTVSPPPEPVSGPSLRSDHGIDVETAIQQCPSSRNIANDGTMHGRRANENRNTCVVAGIGHSRRQNDDETRRHGVRATCHNKKKTATTHDVVCTTVIATTTTAGTADETARHPSQVPARGGGRRRMVKVSKSLYSGPATDGY